MHIYPKIVTCGGISSALKGDYMGDHQCTTHERTPTFICSGIFVFGATAFLGMETQTFGYSGRLKEPPLAVIS